MNNILIFGGSGQVGTALRNQLLRRDPDINILAPSHEDMPIEDLGKLHAFCETMKQGIAIDLVFNLAAHQAVDQIEKSPQKAWAVNSDAVEVMAMHFGHRLIHFSTDYVFGGRPREFYSEADEPCPINAYGYSKWEGEKAVLRHNGIVVRSSAIFGHGGNREKGGNFIVRMLKLARESHYLSVVNDQTFCPTYAGDLAEELVNFLSRENFLSHADEWEGQHIWHITNSGEASWYDVAKEAVESARIPGVEINGRVSWEPGAPARRPTRSCLSSSMFSLVPWRSALLDYMNEAGLRERT